MALLPFFSSAEPIDDSWFEVGNSNHNAELESIQYIDDNTGFAVGSGGAFLKTTDGGFNWTAYVTGHDYHFKKVVFTDNDTGFIFGTIRIGSNFRTVLLKSTDGGDSWDKILGPEGTYTFWDASFPPDFNENNTAYFVTGLRKLYKTDDGGNTWNIINLDNNFSGIQFFNESVGIATYYSGGANILPITTDGGETWTEIELEDFGRVIAIDAVNDTVAYITSRTHITHTTDAGQTWGEPVSYGTWISNLTQIHFNSATSGYRYVDGNIGRIHKTTDSGESWTQVYDNEDYPVNGMFTRPGGNVDFVSSGGAIFSGDGTNPFVMHTSGTINGSLNNVWFFTENQGVAVGDNGTVLKTENAGTAWNDYDSGVNYYLTALYFTSDDVGYASGFGNVIKTTDGGQTWSPSGSGITSHNFIQSIAFTTESVGYTVGHDVFKTENGGESWTQIHDSYGTKIHFVDEFTGFIVGASEKLLKTTDAGENWTDIYSGITSVHLRGIYFHTTETGVVSGSGGNVFKTTDGGENWTHVHDGPFEYHINDIHFIDDNLGYAAGTQGYLIKTEDGGDTWQQVNSNTIRDLTAIDITPEGTPFIVGQDGIVLRKVPSHTLTFNVTDTEANPIDDAVITFNGVPYTAGHYVFPGLIADDYTYSVTKAGYSVESGTVSIVDEDVTVDITLEQGFKATFSVSGSYYGNLLEGAIISIDGVGSHTTNASGVAVFEPLFPAEDYAYEITADNYISVEGTFDIDNTDIMIEVSMDADLDAPLATAATDVTPFGFTANWEEVAGANSYLLYVSVDDFEDHLVDGLEITGTDYMVDGANPDTEYKYRIKAANQYGVSGFSNVITVTTLPAPAPDAPVALEATAITQTGFTAHWQAADNADGYLLYVSDDDFATQLEGYNGLEVTALEHDITGLEPETTYQYRLKAYNDDGESGFSNIIEVTTDDTDTWVNTVAEANISIYPNPAQNHLTIKGLVSNSLVTVFSVGGEKMMGVKNQSDNLTLDVSTLKNGIYIIRIRAESGVLNKKVIVNKQKVY